MNLKELTIEDVIKKNSREKLKYEKMPLDIISELPDLIKRGYEVVSEDDIVRLQWYGLYHQKPKTGGFMMRIKIPDGILTPIKFRTAAHIAKHYGSGYGELTTRQDIQIHSVKMEALPDIFNLLKEQNLSTVGGCGDTVRNITGCPVAGISSEELFDVRPVIKELNDFFEGNREYSSLPRKHKITVAACPYQCNLPEIHCQAFIGTKKIIDGNEVNGFAVRVGGGLSTVPRISRSLGVFIPVDKVKDFAMAVLDIWKNDLKYRRSFIKARIKFMVDDLGVEEFRLRLEERLGYRLEDLTEYPEPEQETDHLGINEQKQEGLFYIGFPVTAGKLSSEQMIEIADITENAGGEIRLTRQQNIILSDIKKEMIDKVLNGVRQAGLKLSEGLLGKGIACTGEPYCNFAVAETKGRLAEIIAHIENVFGNESENLRINLDGCPHACGHHWIGDIGLMGTTVRTQNGEKHPAYDIILRGGRLRTAAIGKPIGRRIPAEDVKYSLERLIKEYKSEKGKYNGTLSFQKYCIDTDETKLNEILTGSLKG